MTDPPHPFTPTDCDLRGMEWMPLFGARLFMSDFEARASDEEFRAAVRLWWMAWQQVPAASLPNEDAVLCRLAGFGRDIDSWMMVREAALHGFTICSDGRLYHKLLAGQANDAWDRRVRDRNRKAAMRAKKDNPGGNGNDIPPDATRTANGTGEGQDTDETRMSNGHDADIHRMSHGQNADATRTSGGRPRSVRADRTGQEKTRQEKKESGCESESNSAREENLGQNADVPRMSHGTDHEGERNPAPFGAPAHPKRFAIEKDWQPESDDDVKFAAEILGRKGLDQVLEKFVDYHISRGSLMADWDAAWRSWCRKEAEFRQQNQATKH